MVYEVNTTYEPFSKEPEYIEANRAFVEGMDFGPTGRLLDLACGTGLMTELALERKGRTASPDGEGRAMEVVGVDLSRESLRLARERFRELASPPVLLVQGNALRVPLPERSVDAVIMGNAIHMVPDTAALLDEIGRVIRPGGFLAFNGSFYAGTFAPGTEKFYHDWIKLALLYVMEKDRRLRREGRPGIPRKRGSALEAFSHKWLTIDEWTRILDERGFRMGGVSERTVIMTRSSFEKIGAYGGFAETLLSGYPVQESSEALQATAGPALAAEGLERVPRYWIEIIAVRRG